MTMEAQSSAAAQGMVHTRLERMEQGFDAAHFLSLIATADFFGSIFAFAGVAAFVIFYGGKISGPLAVAGQIAGALIALAVVWTMYRVRTNLVLPVVGLFVLAFAIIFARLAATGHLVPTVASWLAVVWYFAWLAAVLYQFLRAGWDVSRLSESGRLVVRGRARGAAAGYLMQLFGIAAICAWLEPRRRRVSVLLFFLATAGFCVCSRKGSGDRCLRSCRASSFSRGM